MKHFKIFFAVLFIGILCASFANKADWTLFETKNWQIYFTKRPTVSTQIVQTEIGALSISLYMYGVPQNETDDNLTYGVAETEYPDSLINSEKSEKELIETFFKNSIQGYIGNVKGTLIKEDTIQYGSFPGRAVKIGIKNGLAIINSRFYLVNNKLYMLQVISPAENDANGSTDKFFHSFVLIK